tara:strand:- start:182 stop:847 length:666 start_codon:yes stop_codon:yes gene_type:complete
MIPSKVDILGNLNFGPFVAHYKIHDTLLEGLIERGKNAIPGSRNKNLAGILGDQRGYSNEDKEWFVKQWQPYVDSYAEGALSYIGSKFDNKMHSKSFQLIDLWINYMKENEYNPQHNHNGQLSWVIYLQTPNLDEEKKAFEGTGLGPGVIGFHYGESMTPRWAEHTYKYEPQEGFGFIFPAQLRHEVFPFKTPGERISVSGNLNFINPMSSSTVMKKSDTI